MSKDIDAVEVIRKVRDDIYEQTKKMSTAELVEFFRRHGSSAKQVINGIQRHDGEPVRQDKESH
jgi:hypothetical protein